jgi:Fe-S cluster biogenesis protein NfuA/nitrite reductase/ring-hydroxylating ferredoxin subunit
MPSTLEDRDFRQRMQRFESLVQEIERSPDTAARARVLELVRTILDLHGVGLEHILGHITAAGAGGRSLVDELTSDEVVSSLLLLYGLHPLDLETRVRQALDKVRPYLRSHGGNVELLSTEDGVVRLQMQGSCHGCPSSAQTLTLAIEDAIYAAAPDIAALDVEGVVQPAATPGTTFIASDSLTLRNGAAPSANGHDWLEVERFSPPPNGACHRREVAGQAIVFCRVEGTLLAYHDSCPACGLDLGEAGLEGHLLVCAHCGQHYDVRAAGRSTDDAERHLEPVPLLEEQSRVRIGLIDSQRRTSHGTETSAAACACAGHGQG